MSERETFHQFIARKPEFQPYRGEEMFHVYTKQINGFAAYADEQVGLLLEELRAKASVDISDIT